jgi:hypothetical protein
VELLSRQGRTNEALQLINQFENRYKGKSSGPYAPTEKQLAFMSIKKSRLQNPVRTTTLTPTA